MRLECGQKVVTGEIRVFGIPQTPAPEAASAAAVSLARYGAPSAQAMAPKRKVTETTTKPARNDLASATAPMMTGEMASPSAWMTRMLTANAVARSSGRVTLARMVLLGPVLKNRQ